MKWLKIYLSLSILLTVFSCKENRTDDGKLRIVCTTGMVADAVKNIAGSRAEVIALMGPGVDPHLYKATQGDLNKLQDADVIVYNGLHLEGKMSEVLSKLSATKKVISIGDKIDKSKLRILGEGVYDPHIWFDVSLWKEGVLFLSEELMKSDSAGKVIYEKNTRAYVEQLDSLHQWVKTSIASIPASQRVLITAHDAFGYFGKAYNIEVKGLQGISTVSDYGLNDVTSLVDELVSRKVKAIFVETSVSDKAIRAVVDGCWSKGHEVTIGGSLFSDAMGELNTEEGTYLGMVKKNVNTIVNALK